ncbi:Ribokinase-like protein [Xylariaceae sp. FL0255]|nr:Ribokinase-like protein [Xylariaceae sp. FL0255]
MPQRGTLGSQPVFVSLGMLVLDEVRFPHYETLYDNPGGSGFYATFGARLLKSSPSSKSIGSIIVAGNDFPQSALDLLKSWDLTLLIHQIPDKPSTRGLLEYEDDLFGRKNFRYLTQPLPPSPLYLKNSPLLKVASIHTLATPEDLQTQLSFLLQLRQEIGIKERPLIVWEPSPLGCDKVHLPAHLEACALVDVVSPNHLELGYLLTGKHSGPDPGLLTSTSASLDKALIESQARKFLDVGIGPERQGIVVVRCGEHGVLNLLANGRAEWLPAYYENGNGDGNRNSSGNSSGASKVFDPTGAGNTFLGAFTVALEEIGDPFEASLRGSVAASFAVEQFGPAQLTPSGNRSENGDELELERWNGVDVYARLEELRMRVLKAAGS